MSSVGCTVIMVIEMKNGKRYSGAFIEDEVCLPKSCIALNNDLSLKEARYCMTVRDLLNVLDHSYGGLFSQYDGLKGFFDDDKQHIKANYIKHQGIKAPLGGQACMEALLISNIKSVKLEEDFSADEGWGGGTIELDLVEQVELFSSSLGSDYSNSIYEAKRNLSSGETVVLRDEEEYGDEGEYDEDGEEYDEDEEEEEDE